MVRLESGLYRYTYTISKSIHVHHITIHRVQVQILDRSELQIENKFQHSNDLQLQTTQSGRWCTPTSNNQANTSPESRKKPCLTDCFRQAMTETGNWICQNAVPERYFPHVVLEWRQCSCWQQTCLRKCRSFHLRRLFVGQKGLLSLPRKEGSSHRKLFPAAGVTAGNKLKDQSVSFNR